MAPSEQPKDDGKQPAQQLLQGSAAYWRSLLAAARNFDAVMAIAERFISTWTTDQLAALPEGCKPPRFIGPEDVSGYAVTLMQSRSHDPDALPELDAMSAFFSAASHRLSQLAAPLG